MFLGCPCDAVMVLEPDQRLPGQHKAYHTLLGQVHIVRPIHDVLHLGPGHREDDLEERKILMS